MVNIEYGFEKEDQKSKKEIKTKGESLNKDSFRLQSKKDDSKQDHILKSAFLMKIFRSRKNRRKNMEKKIVGDRTLSSANGPEIEKYEENLAIDPHHIVQQQIDHQQFIKNSVEAYRDAHIEKKADGGYFVRPKPIDIELKLAIPKGVDENMVIDAFIAQQKTYMEYQCHEMNRIINQQTIEALSGQCLDSEKDQHKNSTDDPSIKQEADENPYKEIENRSDNTRFIEITPEIGNKSEIDCPVRVVIDNLDGTKTTLPINQQSPTQKVVLEKEDHAHLKTNENHSKDKVYEDISKNIENLRV